jgi:hypothetical protein
MPILEPIRRHIPRTLAASSQTVCHRSFPGILHRPPELLHLHARVKRHGRRYRRSSQTKEELARARTRVLYHHSLSASRHGLLPSPREHIPETFGRKHKFPAVVMSAAVAHSHAIVCANTCGRECEPWEWVVHWIVRRADQDG